MMEFHVGQSYQQHHTYCASLEVSPCPSRLVLPMWSGELIAIPVEHRQPPRFDVWDDLQRRPDQLPWTTRCRSQ
jgi:hypothetical protein